MKIRYLAFPVTWFNVATEHAPFVFKWVLRFIYWLLLFVVTLYWVIRIYYIGVADDYVKLHPKREVMVVDVPVDGNDVRYSIDYGYRYDLRSVLLFIKDGSYNKNVYMELAQYKYGYEVDSWHVLLLGLELSRRVNSEMTREEIRREHMSVFKEVRLNR
ncbi:MAG: hypothetical protein ACSHX6_08365 [Akkermansiaceae bacterium]